jgi:hypothetical protein
MSPIEHIKPEFVEFIPKTLQSGVLYVSRKYQTASHLCCCGCGSKVVTPLKPGGWQLTTRRGNVTLNPSIGSWGLPCQSHYFIRGGRIVWAPRWSKEEIEDGRLSDRLARERHFGAEPLRESLAQKVLRWLARIFGR